MLVVDAACVVEIVIRGKMVEEVEARLAQDPVFAAPEIIDVEVLGVVRRELVRGVLDETAAFLAAQSLREWTGIRFGHRPFIERVWELRHNVGTKDAFYIALAEALELTLVTLDGRLSRAPGIRCDIEVLT